MISLSVTPSNPIGFPSPPLNPFEPPEIAQPVIDDVYEGVYFSFDLVYQLFNDLGGDPPQIENISTEVELLSYSSSSVSGLSAQKINQNTIRVSGTIVNAFTDGFFKFLMPDNTLQVLPPDTDQEFVALVQWSPPTTKIIDFMHTIECKVTNLVDNTFQTDSRTFNQTVYWKYDTSLAQFQSLV
jgi:hypothetical protein